MGGDGIRLWPSTTPTIYEMKTERNYVKELIDACHKRDIKFIGYLPGHVGWMPLIDTSSIDGTSSTMHLGLIDELINMGMDGMWIDLAGSMNVLTYFDWTKIAPMIKSKKSDFIIESNPAGMNNGYAVNYRYIDVVTTEGKYEPGNQRVGKWAMTSKKNGSGYDIAVTTRMGR